LSRGASADCARRGALRGCPAISANGRIAGLDAIPGAVFAAAAAWLTGTALDRRLGE
jgi:hypothetical protein